MMSWGMIKFVLHSLVLTSSLFHTHADPKILNQQTVSKRNQAAVIYSTQKPSLMLHLLTLVALMLQQNELQGMALVDLWWAKLSVIHAAPE